LCAQYTPTADKRLFPGAGTGSCRINGAGLALYWLNAGQMALGLKRENWPPIATFSLGNWLQIENKEHREFGHLFQTVEFREN